MSSDKNLPTALIEGLLARKDFVALERELLKMDKYISPDLKQRAWSALADYYLSQGKDVDSILAFNHIRQERIHDGETVADFFRRLKDFIFENRKRLTREDISSLKALVERLRNFYDIYPANGVDVTISTNEITNGLMSLTVTAKRVHKGSVPSEVQRLCYGLDEQMTHEEVVNQLAELLLQEMMKIYEVEKSQSKTEPREFERGKVAKKRKK